MPFTPIFPSVYALALGPVNIFLVEEGGKLTLIDTGYKDSEQQILDAVRALGKQPSDITNIVVTHCHPDHAGSLAALQQQLQVPVWMHHADAEVVRGNTPMVRSTPAPGLLNRLLYNIFIKSVPAYVPFTSVDHEVKDGDQLPVAGGLRALHTPGHSAGHLSFLLPAGGGLIFAADACSNMMGLGYSIVYDDLAEGRRSLAKLATYDVQAFCFGHGSVLKDDGVKRFRKKWAN